ncbi:hypothetical protein DSO57_1029827 [Entomophthora muscae]|uniref:Uncharacterized protein n=1 Tax=Entomophthora muscae TaxID=34485 RepID=A0ACC2UB69_9FUNG|nr:hypothetical protein DSO57_1029827 [Entomophthora muscae]
MADKSKVLLKGKTTPFRIDLQAIQTSIKGLVMNNINYNIVAGMDWFTQVNPSVCWKTKTMTIKLNGVNFNVLKEPNNLILRDTVFVQVINQDDSKHLTKDSTLHIMRYSKFNNIQTQKIQFPELGALLNEYTHVFKEELTELPPPPNKRSNMALTYAKPCPNLHPSTDSSPWRPKHLNVRIDNSPPLEPQAQVQELNLEPGFPRAARPMDCGTARPHFSGVESLQADAEDDGPPSETD